MRRTVLLLAATCLLSGCGPQKKLHRIREQSLGAQVVLSRENDLPELSLGEESHRDTLTVEDPDGNTVLIMRAVKDEDGEMVATDILQAAKVTARFRNVAERSGKVELNFRIIVPEIMQDKDWQLRFHPDLFVLEDSLRLDPILITGSSYRKAQLKGYEHYRRFLDSIVADSTRFVDRFQLEIFLKRNLPGIYRYRNDSTAVSDETFASGYGVTQQQALQHYTNQLRVRHNRRKVARKDQLFRKWVKVPIVTEGLRLDTVIRNSDGDLIYDYVQSIQVRPKLRKATVVLEGEIYEEDRRIYRVPRSEPLSFYISSISGLTDDAVHYRTRVVERRVEANTACYIDFALGRADIRRDQGHNREEMERIEGNLRSLLENREFDLDSIVVTASCSPEGSVTHNRNLSMRRSESVSDYFGSFIRRYRDSVDRERGAVLSLDTDYRDAGTRPIRFLARSNPENWSLLDVLVRDDGTLSEREKEEYGRLATLTSLDEREQRMHALPSYRYIREQLYPRLRTVRFDFHLHRKGLQKDTVHTTVVDTTYMRGVQAIRDREYETALTLLRPYHDYNTAVAYCALDYNASALEVLEGLDRTDKVNYLLALLYSRCGEDGKAAECYLKACRQNPTLVHRGNLDPEISALVKRYRLDGADQDKKDIER